MALTIKKGENTTKYLRIMNVEKIICLPNDTAEAETVQKKIISALYADAATREADVDDYECTEVSYTTQNIVSIAGAYEYLKTLPKYDGAQDA